MPGSSLDQFLGDLNSWLPFLAVLICVACSFALVKRLRAQKAMLDKGEPYSVRGISDTNKLAVLTIWTLVGSIILIEANVVIPEMRGGVELKGAIVMFAGAALVGALAYYYIQALRKLNFDVIKSTSSVASAPDGTKKVAFIIVHGMGVQDRFQMLGEFQQSFLSMDPGNFRVSELPKKPTDDYWSFLVSPTETSRDKYFLDTYEAYWAPHFNGLTNFFSSALFSLKAVLLFAPTLLTTNWKKRCIELGSLILALCVATVLACTAFVLGDSALRQMNGEAKTEASTALRNPSIASHWRYYGESLINVLPRGKPTQGKSELTSKNSNSIAEWNPLVYKKILAGQPWWQVLCSFIVAIAFAFVFASSRKAWIGFRRFGDNVIKSPRAGRTLNDDASSLGDVWSRTSMIGFLILVIQGFNDLLPPSVRLIHPAICLAGISLGILYAAYKIFQWWTINFAGDVQILVERDENRNFFAAREAAIASIGKKIREVCAKDYDRVIVISHSLGTALTLEAIRGLYVQSALVREPNEPVNDSLTFGFLENNFTTLITLGSPLRKLRQFFDTSDAKGEFVQYNRRLDPKIFRSDMTAVHEGKPLPDQVPIVDQGFNLSWLNYFYRADIFADALRNFRYFVADGVDGSRDRSSYPVTADICLKHSAGSRLWQHSNYWYHQGFLTMLFELGSMNRQERFERFRIGHEEDINATHLKYPDVFKHNPNQIYGASYYVNTDLGTPSKTPKVK